MTMVVKIDLESNSSTRWISILLDSEASVSQPLASKAQEAQPEPSHSEPEPAGSVSLRP